MYVLSFCLIRERERALYRYFLEREQRKSERFRERREIVLHVKRDLTKLDLCYCARAPYI